MSVARIWYTLSDEVIGAITGEGANTQLRIFNEAGNQYDFNDSTFKAPASVTTSYVTLTEHNATLDEGRYYYDLTISAAFVDGGYQLAISHVTAPLLEVQGMLAIYNGSEVIGGGGGGGGGLNAQQTRDAMLLAPTGGASAGSIDDLLVHTRLDSTQPNYAPAKESTLNTKIPSNLVFTNAGKVDASSLITTAPTDMALNSTVAKEATVTTKIPTALSFTGANVNAEAKVTAAPSDMALNSTVAKDATVAKEATLNTKIPTNLTFTGSNVNAIKNASDAVGVDFSAAEKASITTAATAATPTVSVGAVTLATSQPNYAPAKVGDAMALTSGERTTLSSVVWEEDLTLHTTPDTAGYVLANAGGGSGLTAQETRDAMALNLSTGVTPGVTSLDAYTSAGAISFSGVIYRRGASGAEGTPSDPIGVWATALAKAISNGTRKIGLDLFGGNATATPAVMGNGTMTDITLIGITPKDSINYQVIPSQYNAVVMNLCVHGSGTRYDNCLFVDCLIPYPGFNNGGGIAGPLYACEFKNCEFDSTIIKGRSQNGDNTGYYKNIILNSKFIDTGIDFGDDTGATFDIIDGNGSIFFMNLATGSSRIVTVVGFDGTLTVQLSCTVGTIRIVGGNVTVIDQGGGCTIIREDNQLDKIIKTTDSLVLDPVYDAAKTAAAPGDAMALTSGERASMAGVTWSYQLSNIITTTSIGKKLKDWILGSDNKVLLSANAQTGVIIPTVTAVTNDVGITQSAADKVWNTATRTLTSFGTLVANIWGATVSGYGAGTTGKKLEDIPTTGGSGLTAQQTRDAMKLAPSVGAPADGSVDKLLHDSATATAVAAIPLNPLLDNDSRLPAGTIAAAGDAMDLTAEGAASAGAEAAAAIISNPTNKLEVAGDGSVIAATVMGSVQGDVQGNINGSVNANITAIDNDINVPALLAAAINNGLALDTTVQSLGVIIPTDIMNMTLNELTTDPGANPELGKAITLLYMALRNKETTTATARTISDDAGTTILTNTLSDNGTTFTKEKLV